MLHEDVDVPAFIAALPAEIRSNIITQWSVIKAKGIAGTFSA